jgi:hypothetical protein
MTGTQLEVQLSTLDIFRVGHAGQQWQNDEKT